MSESSSDPSDSHNLIALSSEPPPNLGKSPFYIFLLLVQR